MLSLLDSTIAALLTPGKGILAADESLPTIGKRFEALGIQSTEENRRAYREMLFTAPGLGSCISGVILFEETLGQKLATGQPMAEYLAQHGMLPGIKVDAGAVDLALFPHEKITEGLDGLRERLADFHARGARFTKWRAVISISETLPSTAAVQANAHALASFAALSQEAGLVPIVEPEVLMDGDHTIERCEHVTTATLRCVFDALADHRVALEHMLLKTGMIINGKKSPYRAELAEIAQETLFSLHRAVPAAVPGIVFLSGGQGDEEASRNLGAICMARNLPWKLTFSFGRALQSAAMKAWNGEVANVARGQAALLEAARRNSASLHDGSTISL